MLALSVRGKQEELDSKQDVVAILREWYACLPHCEFPLWCSRTLKSLLQWLLLDVGSL